MTAKEAKNSKVVFCGKCFFFGYEVVSGGLSTTFTGTGIATWHEEVEEEDGVRCPNCGSTVVEVEASEELLETLNAVLEAVERAYEEGDVACSDFARVHDPWHSRVLTYFTLKLGLKLGLTFLSEKRKLKTEEVEEILKRLRKSSRRVPILAARFYTLTFQRSSPVPQRR